MLLSRLTRACDRGIPCLLGNLDYLTTLKERLVYCVVLSHATGIVGGIFFSYTNIQEIRLQVQQIQYVRQC